VVTLDGETPVLVDSSAWIEFLRRTESAVDRRLTGLIAEGHPLAVAEPVLMELLMGADDEAHAERLRRFLIGFDLRPLKGLRDAERAADIYRACRRLGYTVCSSLDCLIAAVALREGLPVLAADRDFEVIAEVTGLGLV
jgi:predicted nucleic acid-binding protein